MSGHSAQSRKDDPASAHVADRAQVTTLAPMAQKREQARIDAREVTTGIP